MAIGEKTTERHAFRREYHSARVLLVISGSVLAAMEVLGWQPVVTLPWLDLSGVSPERVRLVFAAVAGYSLLRLLIEWNQAHPDLRALKSSKVDLGVSASIGTVALLAFGFRLITERPFTDLPPWWSLGLTAYGLLLGSLVSGLVLDALMIRSKDEALKLGLPHIPAAVRSHLLLAVIIAVPVIPIVIASRKFPQALAGVWPLLAFGPAAIMSAAEAWMLLLSPRRNPDGELRRVAVQRDLRSAFDTHDAHYQIHGWSRRARHEHSPLSAAALSGNVEQVAALLDQGADPNAPDHLGWTALLQATAQGHPNVVSILLGAGANVNAANLAGRTALMFACRYGFTEIAADLLDHGADPNLCPYPENPNALMAAAYQGHAGVVRLLLSRGADPSVQDSSGRTALHYAQDAKHGKIATLLRLATG